MTHAPSQGHAVAPPSEVDHSNGTPILAIVLLVLIVVAAVVLLLALFQLGRRACGCADAVATAIRAAACSGRGRRASTCSRNPACPT